MWETPRGSGFWNAGYISKGREMESLVYEQPGNKVDGSYHSKEGSKYVRGNKWGAKGNEREGEKKGRGSLCSVNTDLTFLHNECLYV
jgi:hypothetical protein